VSSPQVDDGIFSSYARLRFAFVRTGDGLKAVIVFIGDRPVITVPGFAALKTLIRRKSAPPQEGRR